MTVAQMNGVGTHEVRLAPGSRLAAILGVTVERCTSEHHQAVARLGEGLEAVGWAPDGMVEAVRAKLERIDSLIAEADEA